MEKLGTKEEQQARLAEMVKLAKTENCKKCYGRGYEGWDINKAQYIPCNCITKAADKIKLEKFKNG